MDPGVVPSNQTTPEVGKPSLAYPSLSGLPANAMAGDAQQTEQSALGGKHAVGPGDEVRMQGTWFDILVGFSIVTLPMLIFNTVLVVLVAVLREPNSSESVRTEGAIYVDINATAFTTVTSWASTLSAVLGGFLILLGSYPSSYKLVRALKTNNTSNMPTPYQFAMMLDIKAGSVWRTFWRMIVYRTAYREKRAKLASPVWFLTAVLILSVVMSLLVSATDTWLHLATEPVNVFRYTTSPGTNLSVALLDRCLHTNNSQRAQTDWYFQGAPGSDSTPACTLNPSASRLNLISDGSIPTMDVLNNASTIVVPKFHAAADGTPYFYLAPADTEANLRQDYTATTFAVSTACVPKSVECGLRAVSGVQTLFNCSSSNFAGNMGSATEFWNSIKLQYYSDPDFQDFTLYGVNDTFYFYVAANLYREWSYPASHEVVAHQHGDRAVIFGCRSTVYNVRYRVRNGTVVEWHAAPSNATATNAIAGPVMWSEIHLPATRMAFSFTGAVDTADRFASNWAVEYSRIALSMGTFALRAGPALEASARVPTIVSRVPVAPLVALLAANMLYCVVGVWLAAQAVWAVRRGPETKELVERTGTQSVVAALFEETGVSTAPVKDVDDMFTELTQGKAQKVGVMKVPGGGYSYFLRG